MANQNQSVRTCVLKVDLKCCTSCQKKASIKLKEISGVDEVEYNSEKGLMTVTGDVEPMALIRKLNKCGKKTELSSVKYQLEDDDLKSVDEDDTSSDSDSASSYHDPNPMEREFQEKINQQNRTGIPKNPSFLRRLLGCLLCGCFFTSKSKVVQPLSMRSRNWHVPSKFDNGGFPFAASSQVRPPQPMMHYPHMMHHQLPMVPQPPHVPMTAAAAPFNVNMYQAACQPYYVSNQAHPGNNFKITPSLHYQPQKK